ncbi:MAG: amidohydrolase family protein [Xylophilus ampelinus]
MSATSIASRSCDAHVHVFDPARFPYASPRRFTPGRADVAELLAHLRSIDAGRVVLVQPSVYGHDHRCLVDALTQLQGMARGIAVIGPQTSDEEIALLNTVGVRGARLNLVVDGIADLDFAREAIARLSDRIPVEWHIQLHVGLDLVRGIADELMANTRHFVLDHFGLPKDDRRDAAAELRSLTDLMRAGKLTVKLSAPYLCIAQSEDPSTLEPLVAHLCRINPRAVVWGTNWPHTQGTARSESSPIDKIEPFRDVDDASWLQLCRSWLHRLALPASTFDDNSTRLYGFEPSAAGKSA